MKKLFSDNKNNIWFWLFVGVAALLFFAMPLLSRSAGNSGDEDKFQIPQGRYVIDYYKSHGKDTTCLMDSIDRDHNGNIINWNLKYYGCSFDVVTEWINQTFGVNDIAKTRHVCNAFLGWIIVFFGGLIAYRMGSVRRRPDDETECKGWRAGVFAMLLLFFSPRLLGHSFNNPKDIPLAAGIVMTIYYMMMFFRQVSPEGMEKVNVKGKKSPDRPLFASLPFSERTVFIMDIVLLVVSAVILFVTAGFGLGFLILLIAVAAFYFFKNAPKFNPLTLFMLALSLALAVSNRIGGLIVVGYMGLWGLLWLVRYGKQVGSSTVFKTILVAVAVCAVGFFAGLLLWPFAMQSPVHNSIESFKLMSQFDVSLSQLFEGELVSSSSLPWYYTPKFMLMTIPIVVMVGWLLYPFFGAFKKDRRIDSIMIYFCFLFPVFWIVVTKANVYGGWRHSIFTYPPMAIAAGLGFDAFAAWLGAKTKKRLWEGVAVALPFLLMLPPALHTVRNHPYEYVYFNELSGGVKKAFGKYELDYYYHSMREATEWVMEHAEPKADGSKILVGSWHIESTRYFLRTDTVHFATRYANWRNRYEYEWDYMVYPITGSLTSEYLTGPAFPPKDCVHTIKVDDVPIAVVLKRQTMDDYKAVQLLKGKNVDSATVAQATAMLNNALSLNPYNETALIYMSYVNNDPAAKLDYAKRLNEIDSRNQQYIQMLVEAYNNNGDPQAAINLLNDIKKKWNEAYSYVLLAQQYALQGDLDKALSEINTMLKSGILDFKRDQSFGNAINLYAQLNQAMGRDPNMAVNTFYSSYKKGLKENGKKKLAEEFEKELKKAQKNR